MRGQPIAEVRGTRGITRVAAVLLLIILLTPTGGAFAQEAVESKKPHNVRRTTSEVNIDGVIEEQAWLDALILELNYEVRPGENIEPPVRTEVFITYDEGNVLVAFRAYDHEPEMIRARYRDRDQVRGDDWVGILFDTFNDERRAYEFRVNPLGVQTEGIFNQTGGGEGGGRNFDDSWDAISSSCRL